MSNPETVDVYILDGPLGGTVKHMDSREVFTTRTIKFYVPIPFTAKKQEDETYMIKCTQAEYALIGLPSSYGRNRFAALVINAGLGN